MPNTIFDEYLNLMENTESCALHHRWAFTACCGALLGHGVFLPFGSDCLFPTQYVMLMGESSARKSTAVKAARKVLAATGYNTFAAVSTTKEKFLLDLEGRIGDDGEDVEELEYYDSTKAREVFIVNDEFNEFIGLKNMSFIGTLGVLWDWDPREPYTDKVKNSRSVSITEPTVSILGGNTPGNFAMAFPAEILTQGFFSRILLIHGERTEKRFTIPPPLDRAKFDALVEKLVRIKATVLGQINISQSAMDVLDYIYKHDKEYWFDDSRFVSYQGRRFVHLLKLALMTTALAGRKQMEADDAIYANTVLSYTELVMPKAVGEFGKSKNSDLANKIMEILTRSDAPVSQKHLMRAVSRDGQLREIVEAIQTLEQAEKLGSAKSDTGEFVFFANRSGKAKVRKYVEYDRLSAEERSHVK